VSAGPTRWHRSARQFHRVPVPRAVPSATHGPSQLRAPRKMRPGSSVGEGTYDEREGGEKEKKKKKKKKKQKKKKKKKKNSTTHTHLRNTADIYIPNRSHSHAPRKKHALISRSRLRKIERESEAARNALADAAPAPTAHGSTFSFASSVPTVARPLPPAPSGRLTVAFACVHGMLPLLRECRADTVRALRLTRSLLVDHARKLGGVIARIELDAHMVVFREPMAAVAWMVECQVLCDRERIVVVVVSVVVVSVVAVVAAVFVVVKLCVF
jgi:hypothetical protein